MHITKWGEYGILCCIYLAAKAETNEAIGAAEIAHAQDIPLQYTQQILHRLRKGEVITSVRGPHGGFRLSKTPAETTLKDILYAAEGATFEVICETHPIYQEACGPESDCGLKDVWVELRQAIDQILEGKTLAQLITKQRPRMEQLVQLGKTATTPVSL